MSLLRKVFRGIFGLSPAAVLTGLRHGPLKAGHVLVTTLFAYDQVHTRRMRLSDVIRAFSVEDDLKLNAYQWMEGTTSATERVVMAQLIKYFKPAIIVEVGTQRGATTRLFLDNMDSSAKIFTIDLPLEKSPSAHGHTKVPSAGCGVIGCDYKSHPLARNVTQIFGDSFQEKTWTGIPRQVDFAFIDAAHSYEAVKNDTEKLWPKLTKDAVVVWHDYTQGQSREREVGKYLRELMKRREDIFVCDETSLGLRVPTKHLLGATKRIEAFFPQGSYSKRRRNGAIPWLFSSRPGKMPVEART